MATLSYNRPEGGPVVHGPAKSAASIVAIIAAIISFVLSSRGREFRSIFVAHGNFPDGYWVEATGSIELRLSVRIVDGAWHWQQLGGRWKGIPLPRWLMPQTVAYKEVRDGLYRFSVDVRLPLLGSLLSYRGGLTLQARDTAKAAESEIG